ncbi:armadillo-like helical domain-containing protein 3 isoform X3 [Culex pipiens pallens]|uniref:armadillo-like helical domain-containing protein 3 isoform X3 n=1 Tax=Culex pipiens pallens TaxID=42434 RepID=UPI0022AA812F|nr:armadillo-like helical domain-containing protein 3 isoform X3 [Culex pipiens pallens]
MSTRKRSGSGTKQPKEKIVYIFESLFRGEDVVRGYNNFWNELFLITPPSLEILDTEIQQLDDLKMCAAKPNIILVVKKCIEMLDSDNPKRVNNSLITLSSLTFALCRKYSVTQETSENYLEYVVAEAEDEIKSLIDKIKVLLSESDESSFYCIKFLLPILITNSCGRNKIMEYIMAANNLFEPLKKILSDPTQRLKYGNDIVILLTLLVNYRKSDRTNPYAVQLSLLDDEFALHGFGQIISTTLFEFIRLQSTNDVTTHNNSWISSFSSIVGNIFLSEEIDGKSQNIRSVVMADHKNDNSLTNLKLCFIVLTCISEDQYANSMMHNLTFQVFLNKAHMRHRKVTSDRFSKPQPLAATLLDLLTEFIVTHLLKKFPMEHYLLCIGIIQRIIIYQKRCRIRLMYPWKSVWTAIISMLKFIMCQEQQLVKKMNIFNLLTKIQAMALRYTLMETNEFKEDAFKVTSSLINILSIVKHFQIKIKEWLIAESLSTPTEEQIMKQIQSNYDLTLKLQDSLDTFERYSEQPHHLFFSSLVKDAILDTRRIVHNDLIKLCSRNRLKCMTQ